MYIVVHLHQNSQCEEASTPVTAVLCHACAVQHEAHTVHNVALNEQSFFNLQQPK